MTKLITAEEAGRLLGGNKPIPSSTLAYWRKNGQGPAYLKIGRTYRYAEAEVLNYIEQCSFTGETK